MTRKDFDKSFDKIVDSSAFNETFYKGVRIAQERLTKEYMQSEEWKKEMENLKRQSHCQT